VDAIGWFRRGLSVRPAVLPPPESARSRQGHNCRPGRDQDPPGG